MPAALALLLLAGSGRGQDANASFDARFAAGMRSLRAGETLSASHAFAVCRELAATVAPERRPAAAFAAALFLAETAVRAGDPAVKVHARLLEVIADALASGAWQQSGCEALRLHALVLRWQTGPTGSFRRELPPTDRAWLLRDDFFELAPRRLDDYAVAASVLRFELGVGSEREPALLAELRRAAVGGGDEWSDTARAKLATYFAERRAFDRAEVYVARMAPTRSRVLRAWLALQREDHATAERLARELVAAGESAGHQLLADALEASARPDEALGHYDAVLAGVPDPASIAAAQNGRGDCLLRLGRLDEARASYAAALAACGDDRVGLIAERAETTKDLGRLAERAGDRDAAFGNYLTALAIGERARARLLADAFGGSWLRIHADQSTAIDGVLRTWSGDAAAAWQVVHALELGRSRGVLDVTAGTASGPDAEALQQLVRRRLEAVAPAEIEAVATELDALRVRTAAAGDAATVPSAEALRGFARANPGVAMLSWWLGAEQAFLLLVRGDRVERFDLGAVAGCRDAVTAAWRAVATPAGAATGLRLAAERLLPPAVRAQLPDVVLAVVDPTMARLPLAALDLGGEPFGVRHALVQVPSLAVAALLGGRRTHGRGCLVVEAPSRTPLGDRLGLDPLVFEQRECEAVRAAWGDATWLRGSAAAFAGIAARTPDLLHVAAHAIDCPGLPTQSVLLLADGPQVMGALAGLQLPGTLVVLSACAAATGEQRGREGVFGLVEGMLAAGGRGVIAPTTAVNQQATADFMRLLHGALARGVEPAFALREARRALRSTAGGNYAHPHYWGAFTLFGGIPHQQAVSLPPAAGAGWRRPLLWLGAAVLAFAGFRLLPRQQRGVRLR